MLIQALQQRGYGREDSMALTKANFSRVKKAERGRSDEQIAKQAKTNKKSNVS